MNTTTQPEVMAIATRPQQFDLSPQTFEQALTFANYLAESEMVPKQFRGKPGDCLIAMQWGYELRLKPLQALQSIAVINGKPGIYGDAGKAILLEHGCFIDEDDAELVRKNSRARCKIIRPGRPPTERTFSIEDAKTAGLWTKDGPWKNYPYRQLAWRAFWFAARDAAADLLRGMSGLEEVGDIPEKHMGAAVMAQEAEQAKPFYPQADFDKNLPSWEKYMKAGKKTADQIITTVESKAPMTDLQKNVLRGLLPESQGGLKGEVVDAEVADVQPKMTYARVADAITKAQNHDELTDADQWIGSVADEGQRKELAGILATRKDQLAF
jgi:hypothetical protein